MSKSKSDDICVLLEPNSTRGRASFKQLLYLSSKNRKVVVVKMLLRMRKIKRNIFRLWSFWINNLHFTWGSTCYPDMDRTRGR